MRNFTTLAALAAALFFAGAAEAGSVDLSPKAVSKIRVGQTTSDQIESQFGEPQELKISGKGQIWTYVSGDSKGKQAAGTAAKTAGGALKKAAGGWGGLVPKAKSKKTKPTVLQLKFDQKGIVQDFNYQQSK